MIEMRAEVGDIVQASADAIVNAANNELWMGSGVAGAIKAAGGVEIEREAMQQGPIQRGGAVVTGPGRLTNCRAVIHAAAMGGTEWNPTAESVYQATYSALARASERGFVSVAFPALGTGVGGFPLKRAAEEMARAVTDFDAAQPAQSVSRVLFVLRDQAALAAFRRGLFPGAR